MTPNGAVREPAPPGFYLRVRKALGGAPNAFLFLMRARVKRAFGE